MFVLVQVGVLIGKGGDTVRFLQYNSGAKIQIVRDADADMALSMRPVELIGSLESINKAEKLIRDVIQEVSSFSNVPRCLNFYTSISTVSNCFFIAGRCWWFPFSNS